VPDYSHLQMHVNAAVAYNVWQYYQTTGQIRFMYMYGACLLLEIARFFAHLAKKNESTGRYEICGVVGPDEFHVGYPDSRQPGINNNAYTNTMAAWTLCRALELLAILPQDHSQEVCERLNISAEELQLWEDVSKKMYIPIEENGIIWQFSGYENLEEFPGYTDGRLDMEKVNEALREFGGVLNKYKVSKQADVLMLFYVFSADELSELYDRLGYKFDTKGILRNIEYYSKRTANTSTLSRVALTWVLSRMDRTNAWSLLSTFSNPEAPAAVQIPKKEGEVVSGASAKSPDNLSRPDSWSIFREALGSDFWDIQGGTTPEGIHIGAMAGTVDIVQRCYTGIVTRDDVLWLNPRLPKEMVRLAFHFQYRNQVIRLEITRKTATVCVGYSSAKPIKLGFGKEIYELHAGDKKMKIQIKIQKRTLR